MTRLVTCGWETADVNESGVTTAGSGTAGTVTTTPTPRTPSVYCLKIPTTGTNGLIKGFTLPAAKTDVWTRWSVYLHGLTSLGGETTLYSALDATPVAQTSVTFNATDGLLRVYRGTTTALLGTSALTFAQDQWHTLEVRWQATSTTVGIVEVWVDDARWINLTSVDNTGSATVSVSNIRLGDSSNGIFSSGAFMALDDLAINDTAGTVNNGRPGPGSVVLLKPSAAGSNTAQTRGGTDTGANWSQVNEVPPSMAQFVFSATAAVRDTYALQDLPAGTWTINCVEVLAYAQNSDAGAGSLGLTVKSGATTNEGTAQLLASLSPQYFRQLYELDPNGSVAWTATSVNALEAGTTVR